MRMDFPRRPQRHIVIEDRLPLRRAAAEEQSPGLKRENLKGEHELNATCHVH